MSFLATQATGVKIIARVMPPCECCGLAYTSHQTPSGCNQYIPSRPIEDWGTRAVSYGAGMPFFRRLACQSLWLVEGRIQHWREKLEARR